MCACTNDLIASSADDCNTMENHALQCTLNASTSYIETLSIRKIAALKDHHELIIQSQLLNAKDPDALQVRYRTIISSSTLQALRDSLDQVIHVNRVNQVNRLVIEP